MLEKRETVLAAVVAAFTLAVLFGPELAEPAGYHAFADQRMLAGLDHAMDVVSNVAFLVAGLAGAWTLWRLPANRLPVAEGATAALFFMGLAVTSAGSAWYHLQPNDAGLAVDRICMAIAFAGLIGLAAATRVSPRAGIVSSLLVLLAGPWAALHAAATGNVLGWALVQFGGAAVVVGLASLPSREHALDVRWGWVLLAYAAAKLLELDDVAVFEMTGHIVSGHTLKHAVAALAAVPVVMALGRLGSTGQNAPADRNVPAARAPQHLRPWRT